MVPHGNNTRDQKVGQNNEEADGVSYKCWGCLKKLEVLEKYHHIFCDLGGGTF